VIRAPKRQGCRAASPWQHPQPGRDRMNRLNDRLVQAWRGRGSVRPADPRPTKRIGRPCRCQAGDHRMGHSRLHLVHQFAHSTVHLRHARRPSVPIVTYRPPGMDCSENLRRRLLPLASMRQGPGKVAIRPHLSDDPTCGPAPRDRIGPGREPYSATGMFRHLVQTATLPGPWRKRPPGRQSCRMGRSRRHRHAGQRSSRSRG